VTPRAPASPLTYAEAEERSRLIDVLGYHVDLDVGGGEDVFGSVTVVRFGCREPAASSFVEFRPARLRRVVLNGQASAHPVAPGPDEVPDTDAALSAYDDISYVKGASVLRQLVAWTGWPAFIAGLNDYLARYRFGSATLDDLLDCLSRASGADLDGWAARWLRTPGVDTLAVRRDGPGAGFVTHDGSRPHRIWIGVYDRAPGDAGKLVLRARLPVSAEADAAAAALPPWTRRRPSSCRTTAISVTVRCGWTRGPGPR
jgi:Peptidase family M1 domain